MRLLLTSAIFAVLLVAPAAAQVADEAMEQRIKDAWADVREFWDSEQRDDTDDPQLRIAAEMWEYYLAHGETPTGLRAAETAFMMWGNIGDAESVEASLDPVSPASELWARILTSIGNAYYRNERGDDFRALLNRLEREVPPGAGRSEVLLTLASVVRSSDVPRAIDYYNEVIEMAAHPFDVQKAESQLYEIEHLSHGKPAPDFAAETVDGETVRLSDLRGKVVLLEFWASWCGPCIPEVPHLKALHNELSASDFQLIGINEDRDLDAFARFVEEHDITWPQIHQTSEFEDGVLHQGEILAAYNVLGIPRSVLIDRDGSIVALDLRGDAMEQEVRSLVARTH